MNIEKTCAFTGHREITDSIDWDLLRTFIENLIAQGYEEFLCGMARGFDLLAAELIIELKEKFPAIRLIACVPCPNQQKYYPAGDEERYEKLIELCDEVRVLSDHYYNGCMIARDRYMVDNSATLIAYQRKSEGGTFFTVNYARRKEKNVFIV